MDTTPAYTDPRSTLDPVKEAALVSRVTTDYMLRSLATLAELFGGDVLLGIVYLALTKATLVNRAAARNAYDTDHGVLPDDLRRPVTANSVAASLGMPRETVRRYINRLLELGVCERLADRRLIVTSEILRRPVFREAAARNYYDVARLMADLHQVAPLLSAEVQRRTT